nr:hypothetical protein [uncultured Enterobacter sp.]
MSKFACSCTYVMHLSSGDNTYEYAFVSEGKINEIIGVSEQNNNYIDADDFIGIIDSNRTRVLRCPQCFRIWVQNDEGTYHSYLKETVSLHTVRSEAMR